MSAASEVPGRPRGRRRWWLWAVAAILVVVPALLIAALPLLASSPWAKKKIEAEANRILAPGGVSFDAVRLSWFRPTEIAAPALLDSGGRKLVAAPSGTFSWSFWDILVAKPIEGTLTLRGGAVGIGRSTEGDVDLIETLKPILKDKPERTIRIRIEDATLDFSQEGVADPFHADHADIALDLARYPEPIAWDLKLARDRQGNKPGRMTIAGHLGRIEEGVNPMRNVALSVTGDAWPWRIAPVGSDLEGLRTSGTLSGAIDLKVVDGVMTTTGDATLLDFTAEGPRLAGDVLTQSPVRIGWKAEGKNGVYRVERFAFDAPAATLSASGEFPPAADRSVKLEGRVDLTVANLLRRSLRLRDDVAVDKGAVTLSAEARAREGEAAGQRIEIHAALEDLVARKGETAIAWNDPTDLTLLIDRSPDSIALERLDVRTPFLTASGRGDLDAGIVVDASFDLAAARAKAREWVDLGAFDAAGAGTLRARYARREGGYRLDGDGAIKGLVLAGLPLLDEARRDEITAQFAIDGEADSSGLPRDWRHASLAARSAQDELTLETTSSRDRPVPEAVKVAARTVVGLAGAQRVAEISGNVAANPGAAEARDLRLAIGHASEPDANGKIVSQSPYVWRGEALYDVAKDELKITRHDAPPEGDEREPAVSIDDVLAGGLRSNGATWFHVRASGDFDSIRDAYGLKDLPVGGVLAVECDGKQAGDLWDLDGIVQGQKLVFSEKDGAMTDLGMITLSLDSRLAARERRLDVASLNLDTPFGKADGAGTIGVSADVATIDAKGTVEPNWDRLTRELAARVEPNASIRGGPHAWSLAGQLPLADDSSAKARSTLNGEVGLNLELVDVFGMRLEKTALTLRAVDGKPVIDPIDSMLNGGRLQLDPAIVEDEEGGRWLTLGKGSSLAGAIVNDEVSHRYLSYVAPVLDQSTRVQGKVSFDLVDARFDLDGDPTKTRVEGDVQFDDVRFMPGPLVDQLIDVFNLQRKAIFVLRDPVSVRIMGRTIHQEGLILPVGDVAVIGLEGWIDFDKRIDMLATFAAVPPQRDIPVLSAVLRNAQIQVPLTGTLDKPKIDGERIKERFQDLGQSILETTLGVGAGIGDLFRRGPGRARPVPPPPPFLNPPARPEPQPGGGGGAPPPPPRPGVEPEMELELPGMRVPLSRTPEERQLEKEARQLRRQEKRDERRARQGLPPS